MRWSYAEVRGLPLPVFARVVAFCNEHVVGKSGGDLDDLE